MHNVNDFRVNDINSPEQWRWVEEKAFWAARNMLMGRRMTSVTQPLGFGVEAVSFDEYSEVADAEITFTWGETGPIDSAVKSRTTIAVPIIRRDVFVPRRKLASSQRWGTPLDLSSIDSAVYKVAYKEDELLYNGVDFDGDGTYEISGFYTGAGNDYSTTKDWGTAANIETSLVGGIALLLADNITPPYNISLNPAQYAQAFALRTYTDASYVNIAEGLIGGTMLPVSVQTAGTALMSKEPFAGFFDVALTQDLIIERNLTPGKNLHVSIFEALVPRIKDSNSLCKLSAI